MSICKQNIKPAPKGRGRQQRCGKGKMTTGRLLYRTSRTAPTSGRVHWYAPRSTVPPAETIGAPA